MVYAPVIIPTLCRSVHFKRCLESLKKNTWAEFTDVYIGLDYPAKEIHWKGYKEICEYLENGDFSCFKSFHVIKREENYGAGKNSRDLRETVLKNHECFIRTDDDIEFSPNFIEFMDKGLELSRGDERIIAVSGYSYPIDWDVSEESNCFLQNVLGPMWGTGFWKDRFEEFRKDVESGVLIDLFPKMVKSGTKKKMIDRAWNEYVRYVTSVYPERSLIAKCTDISLRIYLAIYDKYVLLPTLSKTRNWGFDGSGVCRENIDVNIGGQHASDYPYVKQPIDDKKEFDICIDEKEAWEENRNRYNTFDNEMYSPIKARLRTAIYLLLGKRAYHSVQKLVCRILFKIDM